MQKLLIVIQPENVSKVLTDIEMESLISILDKLAENEIRLDIKYKELSNQD